MKAKIKITCALATSFLVLSGAFLASKMNDATPSYATGEVTMKGDGSEEHPYQIYTKEQFEKFRDIVNGSGETQNTAASASLYRNIDLEGSDSNKWSPIGSDGYTGTFDGRNHSVSGLYISYSGGATVNMGLFSKLGANGKIKNLIVGGGITITALQTGSGVGGLVGLVDASATVDRCSSSVTITNSGSGNIGGIAGLNRGNITNSINSGNISAGNNVDRAGGIVGQGGDGSGTSPSVSYCYNTGTVSGNVSDMEKGIGGICGGTNYGSIAYSYNAGAISGGARTGGIAGSADESGGSPTLHDCYNLGTVNGGSNNYVGGVAGYNYRTIYHCFNYATVTGSSNVRGALVGGNAKNINTSYALTGTQTKLYEHIAGVTNNNGFLSADQFKETSNFIGWDFQHTWEIKDNADYPTLRDMPVIEEAQDEPDHEHNFTYTVDGATITATCSAEGCTLPESQATLTINAPSGSLVYDGYAKTATLSSFDSNIFSPDAIQYWQGETGVPACVNAGSYVATVTSNGKTAQVAFEIVKADPTSYTVPTGLTAPYGTSLSAVSLPEHWSWKTPTDLVGNVGDQEHDAIFTPNDTTNFNTKTVKVSIAVTKADPNVTVPEGLTAAYGSKLSSITLPEGWAWDSPNDAVGEIGQRQHPATYTPEDTANYNTKAANLTVTVTKIDPQVNVPTGLTATYGDALSSITLPEGWAWKNPTDKVGNVGERQHEAVYTPSDTDHYNTKTATLTVTVSKADPEANPPTGLTAVYGATLSSVTLPEGWAWKNPTDKVGNAGNRQHEAVYTPSDTANYNTKTASLTVVVSKADPTFTLPTGLEAVCGDTLSKVSLPSGWSWMNPNQDVGTAGAHTFKAKFTPADTENYNIVENVDLSVNVTWTVADTGVEGLKVTINGVTTYDASVEVKVEVKASFTTEEKRSDYNEIAKQFIAADEDLAAVYNVKLIRTINGVEEEIQPTDLGANASVTVIIDLPSSLTGKDFRLLHIHNSKDVSEVSNYTLSADKKTLTLETNKLSEFAFVIHTDVDNGFIYQTGLSGGAIAGIVIGSFFFVLIGLVVFWIFWKKGWIIVDEEAILAVPLSFKNEGEVKLLTLNIKKLKIVTRDYKDVFKTKDDALASLAKE